MHSTRNRSTPSPDRVFERRRSDTDANTFQTRVNCWHAGVNGRRAPRIDLRRPGVLINSDGAAADVVILDVSSGGFRLEVSECPRVGEFVTLRFEHCDEFPAQIRWVLGSEAGGVFLTPVNGGAG